MRGTLKGLGLPEHLGLAYDAWADTGDDGKVVDRARWLSDLGEIVIPSDYGFAFERWRSSLGGPRDRTFEIALASRLLVGHGNPSATDVGITVHHTWGVPLIPGAAVKGLLAHYVDATYGPDDPMLEPWEQAGADRPRADYQGVTWKDGRIHRGPGHVYRALFGAADAEVDQAMRANGFDAGAAAGLVTFHDALYVPGSSQGEKPFAADVLTVHSRGYYESRGATPPNDYDDPNPVGFLTVRPRTTFLFALSGPPDWTSLAERLVRDALDEWGVGGKTSAGYGRLRARAQSPSAPVRPAAAVTTRVGSSPKVGDRVEGTLQDARTKKGGWKARFEPSGQVGPVQNSGDVPPDKKPGDRVALLVKAVTPEIAFTYVHEGNAGRTKAKGTK